MEALLALAAVLSALTTTGIVVSLLDGALAFFRETGVGDFLLGTQWTPLFANGEHAVLPILSGTLVVTAIAMVVAVPLGLEAALYLSEYAGRRSRAALKPVLEVLAGVPTVARTVVLPLRCPASSPPSCSACPAPGRRWSR